MESTHLRYHATPLGFAWEQRVAPDGYEWVDPRRTRHTLLRPVFRPGPSPVGKGEWRRCRPLQELPMLYRDFAELGRGKVPIQEAIVSFANTFGLLGVEHELETPDLVTAELVNWAIWERLETWQWEILVMRHALRVWEALTDESASASLSKQKLREWFPSKTRPRWGQQVAVYAPSSETERLPDDAYLAIQPQPGHEDQAQPKAAIAGGRLKGEFTWYFDPRMRRPSSEARAWSFLCLVVSIRLDNYLSPMLVRAERPFVGVAPTNLLGALWLQASLMMEGLTAHRRCGKCGRWFDIPKHKRGMAQRARFCSDACRVASHREHSRSGPTRKRARLRSSTSLPRSRAAPGKPAARKK